MCWLFFVIPGGNLKELRMNYHTKFSPYFAAAKSNATPLAPQFHMKIFAS